MLHSILVISITNKRLSPILDYLDSSLKNYFGYKPNVIDWEWGGLTKGRKGGFLSLSLLTDLIEVF